MLIQKSYEFTCLIIAIFGKDCQVFFPYLAIIFLFFSATKNSGTQCPEKEMTAFHTISNCLGSQRGTNSPALRDMHLLTRKTPSVSTPRHQGK